MDDVSPTKWHRAHVTWFFEAFVLGAADPDYRPFEATYHYLFNSYYQTVGAMHPRPERGLLSRPTVAEVGTWRAHVDDAMARLLEARGDDLGELAQVIEVGLHHEQQHQELMLTDLKHVLASNPLRPVYDAREWTPGAPTKALTWTRFEEGFTEVGHQGPGFCFDNETPRHRLHLRSFELANRLVTAGEWLAFMRDGGYETVTLWLAQGWDVVKREGWRAPMYWFEEDGEWRVHTLRGIRPVDPAEPVCHVSFYEAEAFATWAGARLPSEFEWEHAAAGAPIQGNFVGEGHLHPRPAPSGEGLVQLFGDLWEWTRSGYDPYPGYQPLPGALGEYNGKFMVSQYVLRGGSCASSQDHLRPTYRNFFYAKDRWQFMGLRLARDAS